MKHKNEATSNVSLIYKSLIVTQHLNQRKVFKLKLFSARENLIFFTFSREFFVWLGTSSEDFDEPSLQISHWRALFCKTLFFSSNIIMFNVFEKSPTLFNLCVYTKQIPNHKGFARFWNKKKLCRQCEVCYRKQYKIFLMTKEISL